MATLFGHTLTWLPGILLILLALGQFAFVSFHSRRSLALINQYRRRKFKNLESAAEVARLKSKLCNEQGNGIQWRVMEVAEIRDESADCRSFYLTDPYGQPLNPFFPGQYLMVRPALAGEYQATRCYSLSCSPNDRYYRITVKRQPRQETEPLSPAKRNRSGLSIWLHQNIGVGDCLLIGGPSGDFYLEPDTLAPIVLLAAGVGITPMASMLRWSLEHTPQRPVVLLYQVKDLVHWPLGPTLHRWQASFPNIRIVSFFSRSTDQELQPLRTKLAGDLQLGKFDAATVASVLPVQQAHYYMCGPDAWMESLRQGLLKAGAADTQVHWESFGGNAPGTGGQSAQGDVSVPVRFQSSDVDTNWTDPQESLWELARANDVEIPSGCLSGVCGCCKTRLVSGEVEYDREISLNLAQDECLPCVARPKTEVCLEA